MYVYIHCQVIVAYKYLDLVFFVLYHLENINYNMIFVIQKLRFQGL